MNHASLVVLHDGHLYVAVLVGEDEVALLHVVVVAVVACIAYPLGSHAMSSLPSVGAAELECGNPSRSAAVLTASEAVETVGLCPVESREQQQSVVLCPFEEDVVLRGGLHGKVSEQGCLRLLQSAVCIPVGGECGACLQDALCLAAIGSSKWD